MVRIPTGGDELTAAEEIRVQEIQSLADTSATEALGKTSGSVVKVTPPGTGAPALGADDNYVTDAEKTVIGNTSGTNTGDNATNSQYSGDYRPSGTNVAVADGGTGASDAATARTNLGVAASGANADITSLTGLTGAVTIASVEGVDYNPGSDVDINLMTLGVTGTPRLYWDESEDAFRIANNFIVDGKIGLGAIAVSTARLKVSGNGDTTNQFAGINISGNFSGTTGSQYGLYNVPTFNASGLDYAVGSFYNPIFTGTIGQGWGAKFQLQTGTGGAVTNGVALYVATPYMPAGAITNNYGLQIEAIIGGSVNYAIHTAGGIIILNDTKTDTGDPTGYEGRIYINIIDNKIKMYADGAWRQLATW